MNIVVVGDVLLDIDARGAARRLSPDGPVPVVDVARELPRPGGAGLAARLLKEAGHETTLVTLLGRDEPAGTLTDTLDGVKLVTGDSGRPTPVKKRLIADGQVVARTDYNCEVGHNAPVTEDMLRTIRGAEAILVSDYGRGLTANPDLRQALREVAEQIPIVWDPHPKGAEPVTGVAVVTPNLPEVQTVTDQRGEGTRAIARAAATLLKLWPARAAVITLGGEGAAVFSRAGLPQFVPATRQISGDTCGAGDQFAGVLTAQLADEVPLADAVAAAVRAAGDFIAGGGVDSLGEAVRKDSPADDLTARISEVQARGGTVVATGGCFDLIHAGHARTLTAARSLGDMLIVCLNSDESVRQLKGPERPIMSQVDRVELLESLECVDAVVVFDEDTPENILAQLRPDLWVKGGDYDIDSLPEARLIRSWGGQALTVPYHPARSTTRLAQAIDSMN